MTLCPPVKTILLSWRFFSRSTENGTVWGVRLLKKICKILADHAVHCLLGQQGSSSKVFSKNNTYVFRLHYGCDHDRAASGCEYMYQISAPYFWLTVRLFSTTNATGNVLCEGVPQSTSSRVVSKHSSSVARIMLKCSAAHTKLALRHNILACHSRGAIQ